MLINSREKVLHRVAAKTEQELRELVQRTFNIDFSLGVVKVTGFTSFTLGNQRFFTWVYYGK